MMDTVTIVIGIAVACVLFKVLSWFLICRNANEESKRFRARQLIRLNRGNRELSAVPRFTNIKDVEDSQTASRPMVVPAPVVLPIPEDPDTSHDSHLEDPNPGSDLDPESGSGSGSGLTGVDPASLATGAVVGATAGALVAGAATAAASSTSDPGDEDANTDDAPASDHPESSGNPETSSGNQDSAGDTGNPERSDDLNQEPRGSPPEVPPEVMVPLAAGGSVVATTISGPQEGKTLPNDPSPLLVSPAPQPVSDFDDYKALSPDNLPPTLPSPSPPVYEEPIPPTPPSSLRQLEKQKRKMERRLFDQDGLDF